jgi:hypothetical protein
MEVPRLFVFGLADDNRKARRLAICRGRRIGKPISACSFPGANGAEVNRARPCRHGAHCCGASHHRQTINMSGDRSPTAPCVVMPRKGGLGEFLLLFPCGLLNGSKSYFALHKIARGFLAWQ